MSKYKVPSPFMRYRTARLFGFPIKSALDCFFFGGIRIRREYKRREAEEAKYLLQLKPCPDCGVKPEITVLTNSIAIKCPECGAMIVKTRQTQNYIEKAIQEWNKLEKREKEND